MTNETYERTFEDLDLERTFASDAPPQIDPHQDESARRYGMSFLVNIPIFKHVGNAAMLDANKRDGTGAIIENRKYIPRLRLIPFKEISVPVPAENIASRTSSGSYEAHMKAFNPDAADASDSMIRVVRKTPLKCAEYFLATYGAEGGVIYNSLTGIESYNRAEAMLMRVLPLQNPNIFPRHSRIVLGEEFISPFLDEILDYLQSSDARRNLIGHSEDGLLISLFDEILAGARNANTIAKAQISTTEADMTATPQRKTAYDMRDTSFRDSPEPYDLVCLAHRNETPKADRLLNQQRKLQETGNEPLQQVAVSMNEVARLMLENQKNQAPAAASPMTGLTAEQIAKIIDRKVSEGIERAMNAAQPSNVPAPAAVVNETTTTEAGDVVGSTTIKSGSQVGKKSSKVNE